MQLTCPECGQQISADNINVQQMIAVCPTCDNVFQIELPKSKPKRRKTMQPQDMTVDDGKILKMTFRTNFRLDRNEGFIFSTIMGIVISFVTLMTLTQNFNGVYPLPVMFALMALSSFYVTALIAFNKTHIEMSNTAISISRQPLPSLFHQTTFVSRSDIVSIYSEETPISIKAAYDTPRYNVWAERVDGTRVVVAKDLIEQYANFVAQQLDERLEPDVDVSRLVNVDHGTVFDDQTTIEATHTPDMNQHHE